MKTYLKNIGYTLLLGLCLTTLIGSTSALAAKDRGGEVGESCNGGPLFLFMMGGTQLADETQVPEAAQYELDRVGTGLTEDQIVDGFVKFIDQKRPDLSASVHAAIPQISYDNVNQIEVLDTGFNIDSASKIFFGCTKKQIAVQDFNYPSLGHSTVRLYTPEFNKLSVLRRGLLKIHEIFIYIAHEKTHNLIEMEHEAKGIVASFLSSPDLLGTLLVSLTQAQNLPPESASQNYANILESMVPYAGERYRKETMVASVTQMLDAGLNPNQLLQCKMPLLHYLISYRVMTSGAPDNLPGFSGPAVAMINTHPDLNQTDIHGNLPIHLAVQRADADVTRALITQGADINAPLCAPGSKEGSTPKTPLDLADSESTKVLKSLGAKYGKELSFRCSAQPKLSRPDKKSENCGAIERTLAF